MRMKRTVELVIVDVGYCLEATLLSLIFKEKVRETKGPDWLITYPQSFVISPSLTQLLLGLINRVRGFMGKWKF